MGDTGLRVLTAIEPEARAIRGHLPPGVGVEVIGIGGTRLAAAVAPEAGGVVLMIGLAGALDPALGVGDVVLDDPSGRVSGVVPVRRGRVHTAAAIVATPAEKAALFAATGAAVVDMEQAAVRAWAERHGAVVVGVRAVSDTAAQTLEPAVLRLVTDVGRPRPLAIAGALLRRPSLVPYLWKLGANTRVALGRLGPATRAVIDGLRADGR